MMRFPGVFCALAASSLLVATVHALDTETNMDSLLPSHGSIRQRQLTPNSTGTKAANNETTAVGDFFNFRATYKGRFQVIADGCEGPPPVVQAACAGSQIHLVSVSDVTKMTCTPSSDLPDGFASGLTCRTLCDDEYHEDSEACETSLYRNDGSYSTSEGPWAEIVYECLGQEQEEEVDTLFRFLDTGNGTCAWRFFFDNQLYHVAQLGVLCHNNDNNNNNDKDDNHPVDGSGQVAIGRTESVPSFSFDHAYFECSRGDEVATLIDFESPFQDDLLCAVGQNCHGGDCQVPLHTMHIHADVHQFDKHQCSTVLDPSAVAEEAEKEEPTATAAPPGNYTMRFQAGWTLLFKNPEFWYDLGDIECSLPVVGEFTTFRENNILPIHITCPNNGVIERVVEEDSSTVHCDKVNQDTLECIHEDGEEEDLTAYINSFTTVVYECTTTSQYPTTTVIYPANYVTCLDDVYDDLVVGQALQIGQFCRSTEHTTTTTTNSQDSSYRYDDFYYECGRQNDYLLLDGNDGDVGDRFTCLASVKVPSSNLIMPIGGVIMTTEWRDDTTGNSLPGGAPDPLCYTYVPAEEDAAADTAATTITIISNTGTDPEVP
ncbi:expressed unknown protein [Seminavis robusta]|uniref:Uncharacterized protein n=1 Tax=Seminavis robusta TaxID=568900 RepID=A0A9N8DG17_9STRA|nr:expressed unknown protein [Seminavis robusta]|eukprot:Sro107_g053970.1 n/a (602) ;mRNA; f:89548-91451